MEHWSVARCFQPKTLTCPQKKNEQKRVSNITLPTNPSVMPLRSGKKEKGRQLSHRFLPVS